MATKNANHTLKSPDAVALLKSDHRQVEQWFEEFEKARSAKVKQRLATEICNALRVHTEIEEEIFYPAFLQATKDADMEESDPSDDYFDSKVHVLSEMIKHHVKEEEKPDGMFAEARKSKMDLAALGQQLRHRKAELMETAEAT